MKEYQGFAISNFRTGFDEAVEPWLLPRDAYQSVMNAHLYRGQLEKIEGYQLYAKFTNRKIESIGVPDGIKKTWTGTLSALPVTTNVTAYGTINVGAGTAEKFVFNGYDPINPRLNLLGSATGTGYIDYTNGSYSITFNTAPPADTYSCMFFIFDEAPAGQNAIMGIKPYYSSNSSEDIIVFDELRVGKIINNTGALAQAMGCLQAISELPHEYFEDTIITGDGATNPWTGTLTGAPLVPGTLIWTVYLVADNSVSSTITDNGFGVLSGSGVTTGNINYVTGAFTITFTAALPNTKYVSSVTGIFGDIFTGGISNFFSVTNYQYKLFFTNGVDEIMYWDGTLVHYLNTNVTLKKITDTNGIPVYDISTCLHVFTNRERLLLISPTVFGVPAVSTIFWSTAGNPLDFTNDEQLQASTSEPIRAIGYINSDLVVRFAKSERVFRYTADAFSPFRFDSTNNIWACDAPYSTINYDSWFSTVGKPAIVGSDAVNVRRADEIIPDFTDPSREQQQTPVPFINQTSIQQCYGERFDDLKEGWLCYNSQPVDQAQATASDNVLAFNYLDGTYAVYSFPFSCLGFGRIINVPTWGTIYDQWQDMADTWGSFQLTNNSLIDLGGDQFDNVFELNTGNTLGDGTTPVQMSVITKNFNPFIEEGQLCRLGYVDLFVSANQTTKLRVQFYLNDQLYVDSNGDPAGFYQENTLTFVPTDAMSPTTKQIKVWKRIYVGAVGKEHTIRFYQNTNDFTSLTLDQPVNIHAMVLYMKPAGRIFN